MNQKNYELAQNLVPTGFINLATQAQYQRENLLTNLLAQKRMPDVGWDEGTIEFVLHSMSGMDSNNFIKNVGVGEREGRIASKIVANRHFRFAHGIGRSGELLESQPKAAGGSLISKLTNYLVHDAIRIAGLRINHVVCVPLATGMALTMALITIKQQHDEKLREGELIDVKNHYVVFWPRIDQKSCLKAIQTAGFQPIPVALALEGDELHTDMTALEEAMRTHKAAYPRACMVVMSTTSCFAPRAPDLVGSIGALCVKYDAAHVVNNAYGLQDSAVCQNITQACVKSRVDAVIQSTDKNFLVPVGGAIIASPSEDFIENLSNNYPGRASGSPMLDVFVTLLSLGRHGYENLLKHQKEMYKHLKEKLATLAHKYGERLLNTPHNPISIGMTMSTFSVNATAVGSKLFARNVSGVRVLDANERKNVSNIWFDGFGTHTGNYPKAPYLTAAAAIGITQNEVDVFIGRLDKILKNEKANCDSTMKQNGDKASGGS